MTAPATIDNDKPRREWSLAMLMAVAAVLSAHGAFVLKFWWVTDDAYISFRFSRNLAQGEGIRFNVWDQPAVEGYSNFLWVLIGGGVHALGLDMVQWMPVISWLSGAALLTVLLHRMVRVLQIPLPIAAVSVLGLACYPPFAVWTTGGLATMPFALLVLLTFDRLALAGKRPDWIWGGVFGALLALIRVEGVAWFVVVAMLALLVHGLRRRFPLRALLGAVLIVGLVFGGYYIWRYNYYGQALPNTVYAKSVHGLVFYERGFRYVMANALTFLTPFVIVPGALLALRRKRIAVGLGVAALASAFPVYAVVVAGDYLPMGRFLIPGLAFATILLAWLLTDLAGRSAWRTGGALVLGLAAGLFGALPALDVHVVPDKYRAPYNYLRPARKAEAEHERWVRLKLRHKGYGRRGRMIRAYAEQTLEPPVSMAIRALGIIGYETDFIMYDCTGLVVPEIAHRKIIDWAYPPGHDKTVDLSYFTSKRPTILRMWSFKDNPPESIMRQTRKALRAWQRDDVRTHYQPDMVKMTPASGEEPPRYVLVLVLGDQPAATAEAWRTYDRMTRQTLAHLREITY